MTFLDRHKYYTMAAVVFTGKKNSPHQIGAGRLLSLSQFERLVPFVNHVLFLPDLKLKISDNSTRSATRNRQ